MPQFCSVIKHSPHFQFQFQEGPNLAMQFPNVQWQMELQIVMVTSTLTKFCQVVACVVTKCIDISLVPFNQLQVKQFIRIYQRIKKQKFLGFKTELLQYEAPTQIIEKNEEQKKNQSIFNHGQGVDKNILKQTIQDVLVLVLQLLSIFSQIKHIGVALKFSRKY